MDHNDPADTMLSPDLLAEVEALAVAERRSRRDIVREAIELYLQERKPAAETLPKLTPQVAAARMLELRKGNMHLDDADFRALLIHGRR